MENEDNIEVSSHLEATAATEGLTCQRSTDNGKNPIVRSLRMSTNLARSVIEEVPHMIHLSSSDLREVHLDSARSPAGSTFSKLLAAAKSRPEDKREAAKASGMPAKTMIRTELQSPVVDHSHDTEFFVDSLARLKNLHDEASVKRWMSGRKNDLLVGIVVSKWDNIVGPQCVYLWTEETTSVFYPMNLSDHLGRLVKYVTDHTVDHHEVDGVQVLPSTLRSTLCIVRDLQLVYLSVSIRVPVDHANDPSSSYTYLNDKNRPPCSVPHSVAVLANLQYLSQFLLLQPLVLSWLAEFSPKVGVLICKGQLQNSMINSWSAELCKTISAIKTCWSQEAHSKLRYKKPLESRAGEDSRFEDCSFGESPKYLPPETLDQAKGVLETLLTSYLITFGTAIVVGDDAATVNQVMRFLLCFSKAQEAFCSRYVLPTVPDTFMKGLYVQGLMLGDFGERSISYNQITTNRFPFTHVELSKNQVRVRQTNVQSHKYLRDGLLREELSALWNSSSLGSSGFEPFQNVPKDVCTFVSKFLEEMKLLPADKRYLHLLLFKRRLHCKAVALVSYLESISMNPSKERKKLLMSIPQTLGFEDTEYAVVQVAAEKMRSGIMNIIRSKKFEV